MDNDYCQTEGQLTFKTDPDLSRSENICRYINRLNFKPKSFFGAMISSSDALIVKRRQYWGTKTGWDSTKSIILGLKSLVLADDDGSARWNELILQEASSFLPVIKCNHTLMTSALIRRSTLSIPKTYQKEMRRMELSTLLRQ